MEYSNLTLHSTLIGLDDTLEVSIEIHNPSSRAVEEVTQLYLHQQYGRAARPVRELKAFERVTLEAEETRTLHFQIEAAERRYWSSAQGTYVLDESIFDVWVGGASTASLHAQFVVQDSAGSSPQRTEKP